VLKVARPEPFKVPLPRLALPSRKVTVPVGTPPLPLTVALKVTALPASAGFDDELNVVVLGLMIFCERTVEELAPKALLPL
jgi:hypothetical protein